MTPRGWTGACLLLWGHATGQLALAALASVALEAAAVGRVRFEFERRQFERCADASSVAFMLVALYAFGAHRLFGIYALLALLPWCLVPLALMQAYSTAQSVPLSALVYGMRAGGVSRTVDLRLALGLNALLAASVGELPRAHYALGLAALLAWQLWQQRPRPGRHATWFAMLGVAAGGALLLQTGFTHLHGALGDVVSRWLRELPLASADPQRASTAIGSLGRLKLSDRIALRVSAAKPPTPPLLLTEATYGEFRLGTWSNPAATFTTLDAVPGRREWPLAAASADANRYEISVRREREIGVVPVPPEAVRLRGERLLEVQRSAAGALQVEAPAGLLRYTVDTARHVPGARPPTPGDLLIPPAYVPVIGRVAGELGLAGLAPREATARIRAHFARHFSYALVQPTTLQWRMPLAGFLTSSRRGHCEYFASATVLLLRAAGIPARYAIGYSVDEYSRLEGAYIARARDAHAWAVAWLDGGWEVVDTTPARWSTLEDDAAPSLQWMGDTASWLGFTLQRLRAGDAPRLAGALQATGVALLAWIAWRQRGRARRTAAAPPAPAVVAETALTPLLEALHRRGARPLAGETTANFLRRSLPPDASGHALETLIGLYYAARFGGDAPSGADSARLEACVSAWLAAVQAPCSAARNLPSGSPFGRSPR
jgi:transglutaminase-like putative cysteine protease